MKNYKLIPCDKQSTTSPKLYGGQSLELTTAVRGFQ